MDWEVPGRAVGGNGLVFSRFKFLFKPRQTREGASCLRNTNNFETSNKLIALLRRPSYSGCTVRNERDLERL